jgi:hypothetical protein
VGKFILAVDEGYHQRDDDFYLLEHAMDVFSDEFDEKRSRIKSLSRFSEKNLHPVMRISKEEILQYANSAGQILLKIFGIELKKDNGIVLNKKYVDRIFIPLERLHGISAD